MKFALEVWSNSFDQVLATCRAAEALEYDAFYYGESPTGLNLDCWSVLAALARETRAIRLGPVITNVLPGYRAPVLLAKQAATVAQLSGGRLDFRTGAGAAVRFARPWWEPAGIDYPDYHERTRVLEQVLPLLKALWSGESVAVGGGRAPGGFALDFSCPPISVTVAASGVNGMALAARHADVWETSFATPAEFKARARSIKVPARSLETDVFLAATQSGLDGLMRTLKRDRGSRYDAVLARSLHGLPSSVASQVKAFADAGVDQLVLAFHDPHDIAALELFATACR